MSRLQEDLQQLAEQFAALEQWAAEDDGLGSIAGWTSRGLRVTRPLVERLCALEDPIDELPSCPPPPWVAIEVAARVVDRVQRFSMSAGHVMRANTPRLDEASRERLRVLVGNVIGRLYLVVLQPIWKKWPELEIREVE